MLNRMGLTELDATDQYAELREAYRAFMDEHVYAAEPALAREDEAADTQIAELRARAKAEGLWAPHLPPEAGGTDYGLFMIQIRVKEEQTGRRMAEIRPRGFWSGTIEVHEDTSHTYNGETKTVEKNWEVRISWGCGGTDGTVDEIRQALDLLRRHGVHRPADRTQPGTGNPGALFRGLAVPG